MLALGGWKESPNTDTGKVMAKTDMERYLGMLIGKTADRALPWSLKGARCQNE